jgi:beta-aspartyl-dipeptidase (metallo-type)
MTLGDVIEKAAATPARLLGLAGKGRLEPGADADVIVVRSDGTCNDSVLGGRLVMRDREMLVRGDGLMLRPGGI